VESKDQSEILLRMGCAFAQGYYFGRPVPAADIDVLLGRSLDANL
jgi:EAL domain-containing protein (putative c-di-GMP-specific phosphodiesterase class I)